MRLTIALLIGLFCTPADAHCYARWHYPWPQHCRVTLAAFVPKPMDRPSVVLPVARPDIRNIPLPDMSANWGGAMDTDLELSLQRQVAIRKLTQ